MTTLQNIEATHASVHFIQRPRTSRVTSATDAATSCRAAVDGVAGNSKRRAKFRECASNILLFVVVDRYWYLSWVTSVSPLAQEAIIDTVTAAAPYF